MTLRARPWLASATRAGLARPPIPQWGLGLRLSIVAGSLAPPALIAGGSAPPGSRPESHDPPTPRPPHDVTDFRERHLVRWLLRQDSGPSPSFPRTAEVGVVS